MADKKDAPKKEKLSMAGFYTDGIDHSDLSVNAKEVNPKFEGCVNCGNMDVTITDEKDICHNCGFVDEQIEPIKFTWGKTDTFDTIHEKLLGMKGASVVNKLSEKEPLTIFNIGQIEEMELTGLGDGFTKFLDGDENYQTKDGGYNFRGMKVIPMWGFFVEFGMEDKNGTRICMKYNFMIPRNDTYEKDVKVNSIVIDENHPFVFYAFKSNQKS